MSEPQTEAGKTWPSTKTGKRLAACSGRLLLGGEQERLPDGSLTELRSMRASDIALAIEAEAARAAVEARDRDLRAALRDALPRAINFRIPLALPVDSPTWDIIADELVASLDAG